MQAEAVWETLSDVDLGLDRLAIDRRLHDVVELGCGYGTFTSPVARSIAGQLHRFDIAADMVARTRARAQAEGSGADCTYRSASARGCVYDPQIR